MFCLRSGLKLEWIVGDLPDNNSRWRSEWFYIVDQLPGLPRQSGHKPVKIYEWDLGLSSVTPRTTRRSWCWSRT
jgi:hypothetical protein